jgi:hypothetical protein
MKNLKMQFSALLLSTLCLLTGAFGQITGVTAGTDLTGGGTSGNVTLNLNTAKVPQLATANTFTANQTVDGSLTATGLVTAGSFNLGSNPFAFGTYSSANAFLGFGGNSTMTGDYNTAVGYDTLYYDTTGYQNTAIGSVALLYNSTGFSNTALGTSALAFNTTGNYNTSTGDAALQNTSTGSYNTAIGYASGYAADGSSITGSNDTFLGLFTQLTTGTFSNATAVGAYAEVSESNALVLGSYASSPTCKINGCSNTNVGIGTSAPGHLLDVAGTVAFDSTGLNNGSNFIDLTFGLNAGEGISSSRTEGPNQYGIDLFTDFARRISIEQHGNVGIGTATPDNLLTVNGSADKPGGGSWGTYSDGRLKNLNGSYHSGLSQVLKLNPVRYCYKSDNAMGIRDTDEHVGVVAQDVQRVIPEAVTENSKGYLLVNNDPIIWSMLNAIKEQQEEIRALKSELRTTRRSLQKVQTQVAGTQTALVAAK